MLHRNCCLSLREKAFVVFGYAGLALLPISLFSAEPGVLSPRSGWSPVQCPPAPRDTARRFKTVETIDNFDSSLSGWEVFEGQQQAQASLDLIPDRAGGACLRVDFEFTGDKELEYVELGRRVEFDRPGLGIACMLKGDGTRLKMRVRVKDRTGEVHQFGLSGGTPGSDWQYAATSFRTAGGSWAGDDNGKMDYPCVLQSILADRPERGYVGTGKFWLDDVAVVRRIPVESSLSVRVHRMRFGNIYLPGESVRLAVSGTGEAIHWDLKNYYGEILKTGKGGAEGTEIELTVPGRGYYECTLDRIENGRVAEKRIFTFAVLPEREKPAEENEFVGVCTHFRRSAYPLVCMDLLKRLGVKFFRDEISWVNFEKGKGEFSLPGYGAEFIAHAERLGVSPLLIFDYGHPAYDNGGFPNSPEAVNAYARYCAKLAAELHGKVNTFEVWNEWSVACGMKGKPGRNTPEAYAALLQKSYRKIHEASPGVTVVGIGGEHSARHLENIQKMVDSGAADSMESFSVHCYRYPRSPDETDLAGELRKVIETVQKSGGPAAAWVTEIGWPTHSGPRGVKDAIQARYLVRTLGLLASVKGVERVYWYDLKDDGLREEYNEANFGIVRHERFNCCPKPGAAALSVYIHTTTRARPRGPAATGEGWTAVFYDRPDSSSLALAWAPEKESAIRVTGENLTIIDLMGNPLAAREEFKLGPDPVYISGKNLTISSLSPR